MTDKTRADLQPCKPGYFVARDAFGRPAQPDDYTWATNTWKWFDEFMKKINKGECSE